MGIVSKQEQGKQEFKQIIEDLIAKGWTPLTIAREISGGDDSFVKSYRPAIAQKLMKGTTLPNWVVGEALKKLHKKVCA